MDAEKVQKHRLRTQESYAFNWGLNIDLELQSPFIPTHENMAALRIDPVLPAHELASNLRCAFSGIVAGNVKAFGIEQIRKHGPYQLSGDKGITSALDELLRSFEQQNRMKLSKGYKPCYKMK